MTLNPIQVRVLGALIEKEIATPETYPLSVNALIAASNQRSSRDPVMELTEDEVRQALHSLEDIGLTASVRDGRVPKYEHRIRTVLNLRRDETAVLCLLLLRGPQTLGELRGRADRLYSFDDLEAVESTLDRLASRPAASSDDPPGMRGTGPLTGMLPRQPGSREARYVHLLGGPLETVAREFNSGRPGEAVAGRAEDDPARGKTAAARLSELEAEVMNLRAAVASFEMRLSRAEQLLPKELPPKETTE